MSVAKLILMLVCLMSVTVEPKEAKVTPLSSKDLPDLPGKEGLTLLVEYPPGSTDSNPSPQRECLCLRH